MAKSEQQPQFVSAESPGYAGIKTVFGAEPCDVDELPADVDVAAFGVPFDGGVSNEPGTRYGPAALREATDRRSRVFESEDPRTNTTTGKTATYDHVELRDCGDAPVVPNDIDETFDLVRAFTGAVSETTMPVLLGGDHYITYPAFVGYANAVEEDVGLVHLDAHSDTSDDSDLYGKHYHGSPMARIDDFEYGSYDRHAMVGIRGHNRPSMMDLVEERDLFMDYARDVHEKGVETSIREAIDHVTAKTDHVYLTMDIDVVDPGFAPGTGTPEHGGLTSDQFLRAVDLLGECDAIGAVDLMEVAPRIDPTNTTALLGANALSRFFEARFYDRTQ